MILLMKTQNPMEMTGFLVNSVELRHVRVR
jgi:hypothetical protein